MIKKLSDSRAFLISDSFNDSETVLIKWEEITRLRMFDDSSIKVNDLTFYLPSLIVTQETYVEATILWENFILNHVPDII